MLTAGADSVLCSVQRDVDQTLRHGVTHVPVRSVVVEVIDTGPGIPADRQEFIFQEFSRIGDSNKPGAGLGLAISRLLAQALGGQISVESEPGNGSTFTLWLPLHPPTAIAD